MRQNLGMAAPVLPFPMLSGTWFIVQTSLPLWRSRQNPSVTYAPLPDGRVVDTVRFTRRGKPDLILGLDTGQPDGSYVWSGLALVTRWTISRWRVLHAQSDWAITFFTRTPFTPAGIDVYSRTRNLSAEQWQAVRATLARLPEAQPFLTGLFQPQHDQP